MAPTDEVRSIEELSLSHRRVLVRVDFDVPLDASGQVADDAKLRAALPTIQHALSAGARVVLATHLGGPEAPAQSLEPVALRLAELLGREVYLPDECVGDATRKVVSDLREGQLCLLENLRFLPEEAKNDEVLARKLAGLCDVYVSEAFACQHLAYASIVTLPRLVKERGMGYGYQAELAALQRVARDVVRPLVGLLGGAKLSDSIAVLEMMLRRCSVVCVGGGVASTLLAARGVDLQATPIESDWLARARALLARARDSGVELVLPSDVLIGEPGETVDGRAVSVGSMPSGATALDIGPKTLDTFRARIGTAKTVLWHGALGALENPAFSLGTLGMLEALAAAPAFAIVTGKAASAACLARGPELGSAIGFVSTGGVASLVFLEGKQLPGLLALRG